MKSYKLNYDFSRYAENSPEVWTLRYNTLGAAPLEFVEVRAVTRYAVFGLFFSHRFSVGGCDLNGLRSASGDRCRCCKNTHKYYL